LLVNALKFHPITSLFPLMSDAELQALAGDIKAHGLILPITIHEGMILDGRSRFLGSELAGAKLKFETGTNGDSPLSFVISRNLHRRDLTPSQRAVIAVDALPLFEKEAKERQRLSRGRGRKGSAQMRDLKCGKASAQAARYFHVGSRSIELAKTIKAKAPAVFEAVKSGAKTLSEGRRVLQKQDYERRVLAAGSNPDPASVTGPFDIIVADPPWQYAPSGTPIARTEKHYNTLPVDQICALKPDAKPDSLLLLWAIPAMIPEAIQVIKAWGFTYVTEAIWDKGTIGTGCWFRNQHEPLLIAKRGEFSSPCDFQRRSSIFFHEDKREHSRKPEVFYKWVEDTFPGKLKLEMYCRHPRPGWAVWGNEVSPA
jgi:N6-adenosine-specific RNA methylase IME4